MTKDELETSEEARELMSTLTGREEEVLGLLLEDLTYADVAGRLDIGEETVHTHVSNIHQKLRVRSTTAAAKIYWHAKLAGSG